MAERIELVQQYPIEDIDFAKHKIDVRFETEKPESEELTNLVESIRQSGIIEPIIIRPKGATRYEVVAGNRRLRAAKIAKVETVPAIVRDLSDEQAIRIAYAENVHRKNLSPIERAKGIAAVYELIGIEKEKAIQLVKQEYNIKMRGGDRNESDVGLISGFKEAFDQIALSANTQYQILQLICQLPNETQTTIEDTKLSQSKAILLTHSRLRDHPELQQLLAEKIKGKKVSLKDAQAIVDQAIHDLETGATQKETYDDGTVTYTTDNQASENISQEPELEQTFDVTIPKLTGVITGTIGKLLSTKLAKGQIEYTPDVYEPKIEELKKNLATVKKQDKQYFAMHAAVLQLICKAIVDSVK